MKFECPNCSKKTISLINKWRNTHYVKITCTNCNARLKLNTVINGIAVLFESFMYLSGAILLIVNFPLGVAALLWVFGAMVLELLRMLIVPLHLVAQLLPDSSSHE